jgi:hypothetical protein
MIRDYLGRLFWRRGAPWSELCCSLKLVRATAQAAAATLIVLAESTFTPGPIVEETATLLM